MKKNKATLIQIIQFDKNDHHRGTAPYLLAYEKDGKELVRVLGAHLRDPSDFVRNNITRVFVDLATYHPELTIPVDEIAEVLNFPTTTDRNKASSVFAGITQSPTQREKYRPIIMAKAVPIFLKMLRLEQPNNHDPAYTNLRAISGQTYGERDYRAWDNWYRSL